MRNKILVVIVILAALLIISIVSSKLIDFKGKSDKIAVIPINGIITVSGSGLGFDSSGASSTKISAFIEQANKNTAIKGIILEINSPGGSAVASREIAESVKRSKKPVVSWIREVGASGAYWIASSSDFIVADPLTITGSIGATGSYLQFSELFEDYGVSYERLVSGEFKDTGSPFRELQDRERILLQSKIDQIHEFFVTEVASNRQMDRKDVANLATGEFYLGQEAINLGIVDQLGGRELAINITKNLAGIEKADLVRYEEKRKLFDIFGGLNIFYSIGKGIGSELKGNNFDVPIRLN